MNRNLKNAFQCIKSLIDTVYLVEHLQGCIWLKVYLPFHNSIVVLVSFKAAAAWSLSPCIRNADNSGTEISTNSSTERSGFLTDDQSQAKLMTFCSSQRRRYGQVFCGRSGVDLQPTWVKGPTSPGSSLFCYCQHCQRQREPCRDHGPWSHSQTCQTCTHWWWST